MLDFELLNDEGILWIHPEAPLLARDFAQLSETVDRYLVNHDALQGLIIRTEDFPGWEDFSALVAHLKFIRDHHRQVRKVATVSDASLVQQLPAIADHFIAADVKHFPANQLDQALEWVRQPTP